MAETHTVADPAELEEDRIADQMETALNDALRQFRVVRGDDREEVVFAHYHDSGNSHSGHLCFVTISLDGRHVVSRIINAGDWADLAEIVKVLTPAERRKAVTTYAKAQGVEIASSANVLESLPTKKKTPKHEIH